MAKNNSEVAPKCDFIHIHPQIVGIVSDQSALSELYKMFGDKTRIRILYVLLKHEMCVCDIAQLLNMTQSAISHQLRTLKQAHLVKYRREGKTVFYSLADEHVEMILNMGLEHVLEPEVNA